MATAKHKFQKLVFNPANQRLLDLIDEPERLAKDALGIAAHAIIEQFISANKPPHLNKSINQAHFENGTYEQIIIHLQREIELNGLEAPCELQVNTVNQYATRKSEKPKPTCHHCNKPGHYENQFRQPMKQKQQAADTKTSSANTSGAPTNSNSKTNNNNPKNNNKILKTLKPRTV